MSEVPYIKQERIGKGSFGQVFKGISTASKSQVVAIKTINLESSAEELEDIQQEINTLSLLNSPFITKYYGSYVFGSELWIVMEYCQGGSAHDLV